MFARGITKQTALHIPECFKVLVVHDARILSFTDLGGTPDIAPNLSNISPFVGATDLRLTGPVSRGDGCLSVQTKASVSSFRSTVSYLKCREYIYQITSLVFNAL